MKIYRSITVDMATCEVLAADCYEYDGPVAHCKASAQQKQLEQEQASFYQQLTNIFQQQFGQQSAILNFLTGKMESYLNTPQGFTPAQEAALRTDASEQNAAAFQNAEQALQARNFALNGRLVPSGAMTQGLANLTAAGAASEAGAQRQITEQNAALGLQNMWNAASVLGGNAAMLNPLGYANQATNTGQAAFNDATQIQAQSFWNSFLPKFGSTLGGLAGLGIGQGIGQVESALGNLLKQSSAGQLGNLQTQQFGGGGGS